MLYFGLNNSYSFLFPDIYTTGYGLLLLATEDLTPDREGVEDDG
jgi:hypothetical protein